MTQNEISLVDAKSFCGPCLFDLDEQLQTQASTSATQGARNLHIPLPNSFNGQAVGQYVTQETARMIKITSFEGEVGEPVALKSVHLSAHLEGLFLSIKSQQQYRNETGDNLEAVYTFPIAPGATLLGMSIQIGEKRLQGVVIEKKEAAERYEKAIDDGDMPVMLEKSFEGLYTANLGNLKDGESVTIEIESAQLLRVEQGQMRLHIPTVFGQRFGDACTTGGLAPHETGDVNPLVQYPLTLRIDITGAAATAKISCPSHAVSTLSTEECVSVLLESNAFLDRDFILHFDELQGQSFALASSNDEECWVLASFCPRLEAEAAPQNEPLHLKILIDCSGSMQGDSISQARDALAAVTKLLTPADFVSYSRFGDCVRHDTQKMQPCTKRFVEGSLAKAIQATSADLGGTEINMALDSVAAIPSPPRSERGVAVLLITDGASWDVEASVATARQSGHRIYTVGVGSAPAGNLLRALADKTGGACELVSPNEDMEAAIFRTFRRMRSIEATELQVNWGLDPLWQSALPIRLYDNETLHLFARFHTQPPGSPELTWRIKARSFNCKALEVSARQDETLIRLGGAGELRTAQTTEETLAIAMKYQLLSDQSNLYLVHVRAEDEKASTLPTLQKIEHMLAAGQSGFGTVTRAVRKPLKVLRTRGDMLAFAVPTLSHSLDVQSAPAVWRGTRTAAAQQQDSLSSGGMADYEIPAFLRKQENLFVPNDIIKATGVEAARNILVRFNKIASKVVDFGVVIDELTGLVGSSEIGCGLNALISAGGQRELVWGVYLKVLIQNKSIFVRYRHAARLLRRKLDEFSAEEKSNMLAQLTAIF